MEKLSSLRVLSLPLRILVLCFQFFGPEIKLHGQEQP